MHISYKLDRSPIHGIGLFTAEDVAKGQLIYTASPVIDMDITDDQFKSLSATEKKEIQYWGFFDEPSQCWHVDFDVSKFINHAYDGTVTQDERHDDAYLVATRDIKAGEELTQNYLEFESVEDLVARGISA